jgi:hypothetical protein
MSSEFKISKATETIDTVSRGLGSANDLLKHLQPSVVSIVVVVQGLDEYLKDGEECLGLVEKICHVLHEVLKICTYLGPVPVVGTALSRIAKIIENLHIEGTIEKVVKEIRTIIKKVRHLSHAHPPTHRKCVGPRHSAGKSQGDGQQGVVTTHQGCERFAVMERHNGHPSELV